MEELVKNKRAEPEIEQKNMPSSKNKSASVNVALSAKSTTSEEKSNEKIKLNNARKKLQAFTSSPCSSKKPQQPESFNKKDEISNTENLVQIKGNIFTFFISSDEEDNITISSSDEASPSVQPVRNTNSEREPKKLVQKVLTSSKVKISTGNYKGKNMENHNLKTTASKAMVVKDIELKGTTNINIKTSRGTEKIPFLEDNSEVEILEDLIQHIREKNTVTSDEFVPPLFQPKSSKVKNIREIIKPGMLENKENSLAVSSFDLKSPEDINQTLQNSLMASKSVENQSNDQCSRQNDFAPISPIEQFSSKGANNGLSSHSDNNSCLIPNKNLTKSNQTTEDISVIFKDQSTFYNLGYQTHPQHYQQSRIVHMNPRVNFAAMPAHPMSDYRSAYSHSFSRFDPSMQTDIAIPQFSPSEDVPVVPLEMPVKPNYPNTNPIQFYYNSIYKNDINYRGYETRPYNTNHQYRKQYLRQIPLSREYNNRRPKKHTNYDNRLHSDNLGRSNYHTIYYPNQYNTSEARRNYYQRTRSVGMTEFDEERTECSRSPRGDQNNREFIDCQSKTISCVNGQERLQHPFKHRRRGGQRGASVDKTRYSNTCDIKSNTSPLPECKNIKSVRVENFDKERKSESESLSDDYKTSPLPECKNIKSVRAENFDKERESESESLSDSYKQSNEQNNRTENMKNIKKYPSLSEKVKTEKNRAKPIETNKQKNDDLKYKTAKNTPAKFSDIDKIFEKRKLKRLSDTKPNKESKGVKTKYSFKMSTVRGKFKSSMFKKLTKITKKVEGEVIVKRKEIKTTTSNKFSSLGSSINKENSSRPNKVKQSEKVNNYKQTHANRAHFSSSNTKSPEKDIVGKTKKAKKAIIYSDSESEPSLSTRGHCSKLNDKPFKKSSFAKIKRANRQIIYSDSDSETKEAPETKKSVHSKSDSNNRCKDILLNGGLDVMAVLKKTNATKKSSLNVKSHTTADHIHGTKVYELKNDLNVETKNNKFKNIKSAANNSHDIFIKKPLEEEITINDNTTCIENVKQNNTCNNLQDACHEVTQENHRDNVPDLKEQIITEQRINNSEHNQSESSHIYKIAISNEKKIISIDNDVSSVTERCESHSDASSIRHKDEKLDKVVDYPAQEDNVPEMSINACLTLAKDLLKDVPKTIFELFIRDLCLIRPKEEISEITEKLKCIVSNVEVVPSNGSKCDLGKSSTPSFKRTKQLTMKIVKLSKNEFKIKRKHHRRRKHKNLTETAVVPISNDKIVENGKFTTPVMTPVTTPVESQETDSLDKSCHTKITNYKEQKTIEQNQLTFDKNDCFHFKVVNVHGSVKKYACFINGVSDNFTTSSPIELLRHIELKHAEEPVWDGYCSLCEKTVISQPQGQYNYVECLRHMLDTHNIDQFPILYETEATSKDDNQNILLDAELKTHKSEYSNVNHGRNSAIRKIHNSNEFPHFKRICDDSEAETYICCIGGINNHFKTTQKISMIRHARKMHPGVWDGYCCVCKEFVMPPEQLNFGHCFKHMVESHLDNFPVLDQAETHIEMKHPEKANLEPEELSKPKLDEVIENIFNIAKDNSSDTANDNSSVLSSKQLDTQNFLNQNLRQLTSGVETQCRASEDTLTKGTLESLDKGGNTIGKEKNIANSKFEASHSKKDICEPERPLICEELQAKVMKAKHSSVLDSMLSEEKLVQIFKCTGPFCAYTTNLPDKALLHVMTHQKASEKDVNVSFCAYCDFACKDPTDGVAHVFETHGHCNYVCGQCFYRATASQLVLAHMHRVHGSSNNILEVATPPRDELKELLPQEIEINSYTCGNKNICIPECQHSYFTQGSFIHHLRNHDPPYLCFICAHSSDEPTELLLHLSDHGLKQYHCTWCSDGADSEAGFLAHFSACHPTKKPQAYTRNVTNIHEGKIQRIVLPLLEINKPSVATRLVASNIRDPYVENDYAVREVYKALNLEELVTGVSQQHQLLFGNNNADDQYRPSYSEILNQSLPYKLVAKKDTDSIEIHTQDTASGNIGSRNTLKRKLSEQESLENITKNVRYDRQIPSSDVNYAKEPENSTEEMRREVSQYPKYVPNKQLYRCGAEGCLYMSLMETTLKMHWETLHVNNSANYKCPHCQYFVTGAQLTWAKIIEHLNMHGNRLYVCSLCDVYHYHYNVLEEHVSKFHEGVAQPQVKTIRDLFRTPVGNIDFSTTITTVPWKCARCKYRTERKSLMVKHCKNNHPSYSQFKCTECDYEGSKQMVKKHKYKAHGLKNDDVIQNYYFDDGPVNNETVDNQRKENVRKSQEKVQMNIQHSASNASDLSAHVWNCPIPYCQFSTIHVMEFIRHRHRLIV